MADRNYVVEEGRQDPMVNNEGPEAGTSEHSERHGPQTMGGKPANWIPLEEHVLWKPTRKIRMVMIGCGFSGLTMAHKIQNMFKMDDRIDIKIYEKNSDVGGTWYENRYPGVMCDVPAHIYTLLDIPNPDYPRFYAAGDEIQEYLTRIKKQYNLGRDVEYNSKVTECSWEEKAGKWNLKIEKDGSQPVSDTCDILINGSGVLNAWSWPKIPGLHTFSGHLSHSADYKEWTKSHSFSGKRIAVIGNGSSAIQIVPEMAKTASKLYNVVRTPTWISAPFAENLSKAPGTNPAYSDEEKANFRNNPESLAKHRHELAHAFNHFYEALIEGSTANHAARDATRDLMLKRLKDKPELAKKLVPEWSLGCRRLTPGNGYLESLTKENVELVVGNIAEVTQSGITMKDGQKIEVDAIVCATGFDVSFKPRWKQIGRNGRDLSKVWDKDAQGYLSLCVSGFPNHFIFNGPAGPVGHGSLSSAIDWAANYILKWADKVAREGIKSFDVKQKVQDDWNVWGDELLKRTVWASGCRSWYKNGTTDGRISALYPGSILHFKDLVANIRGEDFNIEYRNERNMWGFLGDGFTQLEVDNGDLGYYMTC